MQFHLSRSRGRDSICVHLCLYPIHCFRARLVSFRYRLRFRAVRFAAFMIYLNNWIDAHFWLCRICDCWGRRERSTKGDASFIKCTCWFSFLSVAPFRDLLREWKMRLCQKADGYKKISRKVTLTRYLIEPYASNIFMLWLFMCGVCLTGREWEKNKQWQHKWRRDIAFPDIQSFKHMVNIYFYYINSLFCALAEWSIIAKTKRCIVVLWPLHVFFQKLFLFSLNVHVRHYGGNRKSCSCIIYRLVWFMNT